MNKLKLSLRNLVAALLVIAAPLTLAACSDKEKTIEQQYYGLKQYYSTILRAGDLFAQECRKKPTSSCVLIVQDAQEAAKSANAVIRLADKAIGDDSTLAGYIGSVRLAVDKVKDSLGKYSEVPSKGPTAPEVLERP